MLIQKHQPKQIKRSPFLGRNRTIYRKSVPSIEIGSPKRHFRKRPICVAKSHAISVADALGARRSAPILF
jgi:hypothetical protein